VFYRLPRFTALKRLYKFYTLTIYIFPCHNDKNMSKFNLSSSASTVTQYNDTSISWNEIKSRTLEFQKTWIGEKRERAEKDTFWNEFFGIFGINRRRVASFETAVRKLNNKQGFIDCFWEGVILIEHKSFGKDLDKAFVQATDYFTGLTDAQLPKYILVSDFDRFHLYNLDDKTDVAFGLNELLENIELFGFLAGYAKKDFVAEDPVNIQASVLMGNLHDAIRETGFEGFDLEVFLTRILFILFAEDTQIFETRQFLDYLENRTGVDGFDTGMKIQYLFQILNTPIVKRPNNLDEELVKFAYINGQLFAGTTDIPQFDSKTRLKLIECARFDWSKISPAVFGSLFQSVMNPEQRRTFGAHYTEEKNILKTIEPLFLDDLWAEFDNCKSNKKKLQEFHIKLSKLTFLDPACGCGNFLIVTYRELRKLELQVLVKLHSSQNYPVASQQPLDRGNPPKKFSNRQDSLSSDWFSVVNVDQFYGIEIEEFPAQIAKTAMWLMDHIANLELSKAFGQYYARIPLTASATILHGNSLMTDWNDVIPAQNLSFIIGNPPFVGSKMLNENQRQEIKPIIGHIKNSGILDYVCNWYVKASAMMAINSHIQTAFVSTNSICQGEQVGALWGYLLDECNIRIKFAHQTFAWSSEAKGKANVFCVIVGFYVTESPSFPKSAVISSNRGNRGNEGVSVTPKKLYTYTSPKADPVLKLVPNINPYLVEGGNVIIRSRSKPISDVPEMNAGNVAYDYGYLIFTEDEMNEFVSKEPLSAKWFKKLIGGQELINGGMRYCLWLIDILPNELRQMKYVLDRIEKVKTGRTLAKDTGTHKLANRSSQFRDLNNPKQFIAIPKTSSENREYIPIAIFDQEYIPSDSIRFVESSVLFHFGILTSKMHMAWVKVVCGRLKSDFRYSKDIVYNNFPFPNYPVASQQPLDRGNQMYDRVETLAQKVLDVRLKYTGSSLADLYDPLTMPPDLAKSHTDLDRAVEKCYRAKPFESDEERVEFLFALYEEIVCKLN
jgi:hypothetical protein